MAGVRSIPVTWRAVAAKALAGRPGPQATSRIVSSGPTRAASRRRIECSVEWAGSRANGRAIRVNWSTIRRFCSRESMVVLDSA